MLPVPAASVAPMLGDWAPLDKAPSASAKIFGRSIEHGSKLAPNENAEFAKSLRSRLANPEKSLRPAYLFRKLPIPDVKSPADPMIPPRSSPREEKPD